MSVREIGEPKVLTTLATLLTNFARVKMRSSRPVSPGGGGGDCGIDDRMNTRRSQRRRRVIYSTTATGNLPTPRQTQRLREARKPVAVYGRRVQRRLDARWFSVVPVRRLSMVRFAAAWLIVAAVLTAGHAATQIWPWLSVRPEIARILRIDRVDSLAGYFVTATWTLTGLMALLVYQLRRYRLDDYRGQYRLWRSVLVASVLLSINNVVGGLDLAGAVLQAAVGIRIGLTPQDWVRLIATMMLAVLMIRVLIDVRASRTSALCCVAMMVIAATVEAFRWQWWSIETIRVWIAITSTPVWTASMACIGVTAYLRLVYREVIEVNDRLEWTIPLPKFHRPNFKQAFGRIIPARPGWTIGGEKSAGQQSDASQNDSPPPPKPAARRSKPKSEPISKPAAADPVASVPEATTHDEPIEVAQEAPPKRKRRFGLSSFTRRRPVADDAGSETNAESDTSDISDAGESVAERPAPSPKVAAEPSDVPGEPDNPATESQDFDEDGNPIDWDSLPKAERRRLRKQLRRRNKAA